MTVNDWSRNSNNNSGKNNIINMIMKIKTGKNNKIIIEIVLRSMFGVKLVLDW